ncbi:MAG: hypothetical protein R3272_02225 [Candidatus Promineifilaceae bacterium]|nr:hypothetical protein [Candidatus Promineifilaceae bacterium]
MTLPADYGASSPILERVKEGMDIYDADEDKIGEVDRVYFGTMQAEGASGYEMEDSWIEDFVDVFDTDDLPEPLRESLLANGFIRIEGGLFGSDRYVMPEQIAAVTEEGVFLKPLAEDEIIED